MDIKKQIIEALPDAVDSALDEVVAYAAKHEGIDLFRTGYDQKAIVADLESVVREFDAQELKDAEVLRKEYLRTVVDLKFLAEGDLTLLFNEHYVAPAELVDDWQTKHFRSGCGPLSTEAWLRSEAAMDSSEYWGDVDQWNLEAAADRIDARLLELAEDGELSLENSPADLFDESFWTELHESFGPDEEEPNEWDDDDDE